MHTSERLYYSDSFLKTFTGAVTQVRQLPGGGDDGIWQLSLDRTGFYPTSGGQPFDTGILRPLSPGGTGLEIPVEEVEEDEEGTVWHFVRQPVAAGTPVEGRIDWERRFDHMQQHTGQHLLSAVFLKELQAPQCRFTWVSEHRPSIWQPHCLPRRVWNEWNGLPTRSLLKTLP